MKIIKINNNKYQVRKMIKGKTYYLFFTNKPTTTDIKKALIDKIKTDKPKQEKIKTLKNAITEYLNIKANVLSPSTLRGYKHIFLILPKYLTDIELNKINNNTLQNYINFLALTKSPKRIKNIIGLIRAILTYNNIQLNYNLRYPEKIKQLVYIPTDQDIKKLDTELKTTKYYIFFRLALYGLRVSEILALTPSDIKDNGDLTINKAKVQDQNNIYKIKTTKTITSNRTIKLDTELITQIKKQNYILNHTYKQFYNYFKRLINKLKINYFSPHKLRHYMATKLYDLNIPTKYIQAIGGWSNEQTLMKIYTHTTDTLKENYNNLLNSEYNKILNN